MASSTRCPEAIRKSIRNGGQRNNELSKVYDKLLACPQIRVLHLKISQGGCVVTDNPWSFRFSRGDRLPPLEELHLDGYDFDDFHYNAHRKWDYDNSFWVQARRYVAVYTGFDYIWPAPMRLERLAGGNIDSWKKAMDWSHLKDLELIETSHSFLERMKGELPALKSLKLGPLNWRSRENINVTDYTTAFLLEAPPLTALSMHGYTYLVDWNAILGRHGSTLDRLELRQWESRNPLHPRPTLSLAQLRHVNEVCPHLTELSIDINRNGTWPYEILDSLANFEAVTTLQLWFELGIDQHQDHEYWKGHHSPAEDYRQPVVSSSSALSLFKRLRDLKEGTELQRVRFYVGDVGRDYGHMLRLPGWGEDLAEWYDCNVLDSDGQKKAEGEAWCEPQVAHSVW